MRETLFRSLKLQCVFVFVATGLAYIIDSNFNTRVDYWVHDNATIYQAREKWKYSAIIALDDGVPLSVSRKQALPLFARAIERLIEAGVKGVFFDARVPRQLESQMPYAECVKDNGSIRWSVPECSVISQQSCVLTNSPLGIAPLAMSRKAIQHFLIAPYLDAEQNFPDFLLYGWATASHIPKSGIIANDQLVKKNSAISRWFPLERNHAIYRLAQLINPERVDELVESSDNEICDNNQLCRRVRNSRPIYQLNSIKSGRPILPLSDLASCNIKRALSTAQQLKDRVVVLQVTTVNESTDLIITPFASAIFGPNLVVPGAQYIVDGLETLLNQDHPVSPPTIIKILLFLVASGLGVVLSCNYESIYLVLGGCLLFFVLIALCLLNPVVQLWPVTAGMVAFFAGSFEGIGAILLLANKESRLINQYMPKQIREILLTFGVDRDFQSQRCHAIILMSDLKGYTTLTQLLKEPALILELMNDYLGETSIVLQEKYNGWLETYVGDMVCYYWPCLQEDDVHTNIKDALNGALELSRLQNQFFSSIQRRYQNNLNIDTLKKIDHFINAGIGISCGEVIMGSLGPKKGTQKFGVLGNPLNIASRIESLTRQFSTQIILTESCLRQTQTENFCVRYLGLFQVKGALKPEALYALGQQNDPRFSQVVVEQWLVWLKSFLSNKPEKQLCPEFFEKDRQTLLEWKKRNLLKNGVWILDEK